MIFTSGALAFLDARRLPLPHSEAGSTQSASRSPSLAAVPARPEDPGASHFTRERREAQEKLYQNGLQQDALGDPDLAELLKLEASYGASSPPAMEAIAKWLSEVPSEKEARREHLGKLHGLADLRGQLTILEDAKLRHLLDADSESERRAFAKSLIYQDLPLLSYASATPRAEDLESIRAMAEAATREIMESNAFPPGLLNDEVVDQLAKAHIASAIKARIFNLSSPETQEAGRREYSMRLDQPVQSR
ncbi:hypothetical protein [Luteolibacter luteus]|uniref:Uncharacterized protein n=1 Tax=Luteolibacter luteus TaxID=2728835 RepID=A0A858RQZ3_9BACT|nr:hypothetical protein [Luteolibacter luteus]QJE98540.1 hypothetical protein HHL09_23045 [Luteolibacter luteus]